MDVVDVDATGAVVVGDGGAGGATVVVVPGAGAAVVVGAGCGRLPGFGVVTTGVVTPGLGMVVTGAPVVGVEGTVDPGAVVVGGVRPRRGAGGTMAGLLDALVSLPTMAAISQRSGLLGASSTAVSIRPSSLRFVDGSSNSISFSTGALLPSGSSRHVIL